MEIKNWNKGFFNFTPALNVKIDLAHVFIITWLCFCMQRILKISKGYAKQWASLNDYKKVHIPY